MELQGINSLSAINNHKKLDDQQEGPKTAFINSAFGFGFNNDNNNANIGAAFEA